MQEIDLKEIISIIINDLRNINEIALIEIIKKGEYSIKHAYNTYSNIEHYKLIFHLKYKDFTKIINEKTRYEQLIQSTLDKIYINEQVIISEIEIVSKIEKIIDWCAIAPSENKESLIKLLQEEKETLIRVATGVLQIKDKGVNEEYKKRHKYINKLLEDVLLEPTNPYDDLWSWYYDYNEKELNKYQERREYISNLYKPLFDIIENSETSKIELIQYEPTGWEKIDEAILRLKDKLHNASNIDEYQSIGMCGREVLISLAQIVFDKEKHKSIDGIDIGSSDSKRMLEAYVDYYLKDNCGKREASFIKASIDFSNELTHKRTANAMDAELCYNAVISTIHTIHVINKYND